MVARPLITLMLIRRWTLPSEWLTNDMNERKKILLITPDPNAGGSTKSLLTIVDALKADGYSLLVMGPSSEGYLADSIRERGIKFSVNRYSLPNVWPRHRHIKDILLFPLRLTRFIIFRKLSERYLKKIANDFNPDLIYSNSSILLYGYNIAKKLNIKHLWHIREYIDKDFDLTFYPTNKSKVRLLQSGPTISITKEINSLYKLQTLGTVIYNGVYSTKELSTNCRNNTKQEFPYFVYVGTINETKGCTDLVNAYAKYLKRGGTYKLVICGSYSENYENKMNVLLYKHPACSENIIFEGQCNDIRQHMQTAKAIIVPSPYEAFGRITAEAMFNKCLIIGRNTGGTKEQFDLGLSQTGCEVGIRFGTIEELVNKMLYVENMDEYSVKTFTNPAYQTACNNFTIENLSSKIISFVKEIID